MHDIKTIVEKLLPVFETHKNEEHIEVEMRLGKHNGSFFDTNVGKKTDARSYAAISDELQLDAADILFCSDIAAELDAARTAGMQTCCFVREGTAPRDAGHPVVTTFDAVDLSAF